MARCPNWYWFVLEHRAIVRSTRWKSYCWDSCNGHPWWCLLQAYLRLVNSSSSSLSCNSHCFSCDKHSDVGWIILPTIFYNLKSQWFLLDHVRSIESSSHRIVSSYLISLSNYYCCNGGQLFWCQLGWFKWGRHSIDNWRAKRSRIEGRVRNMYFNRSWLANELYPPQNDFSQGEIKADTWKETIRWVPCRWCRGDSS